MDNRNNDDEGSRDRIENEGRRGRQGRDGASGRQQDQFSRENRQQGGDYVHDSSHGNDRSFGDAQTGGWNTANSEAWRDRSQRRDFTDQGREPGVSRAASESVSDYTTNFGARDEWTDRSAMPRRGDYGGNQANYRDYGAADGLGTRGGSAFSRTGRNYDSDRNRGERGFFDKASDEVSSWFGDREAERRREMDEHRGKGPKGYARSDDRIKEDVNDRLTEDGYLDAGDIDVAVKDREVTLTGFVTDRQAKRHAEDLADAISGVKHVQNNLRVRDPNDKSASTTAGTSAFAAATSKPTGAV